MKVRTLKYLLTTVLLMSFFVSSAQKIYYAPGSEDLTAKIPENKTDLLYTVYLLGDIKYPLPDSENLKLLKNYLSKESNQSAVVFLGDILYPLGMPDSSDKSFPDAKKT